jgi:ribosome biogenesis GTPase
MELSKLGYQPVFDVFIEENQLADFEIGRIITEHKERYIIATRNGEIEAEVTGNLRFTAVGREDFPAVGDWVAFVNYGDETGIIHKILPRYSVLSRRTAGKQNEIQLIAANIDCAFLMQAVDRDFSLNRLERYLTICFSGNVDPVIILTKTDLLSDEKLSEMKNIISQRIKNIPFIAISNETMTGYDELTAMIESGKHIVCLDRRELVNLR